MHQANLIKIKKWNDYHAISLLLAGICSIYWQSTAFIAICAAFSFIFFIFSHHPFLQQYRPWAGYANGVTFFRLSVLIGVSIFFKEFNDIVLFFVFASIIGLDVLDGYLARRLDQTSDFGLYMDMESDSLLVCLVTFILYLGGYMPIWILVVGFMRYLNVGLFCLFKLPPKKEPKRKYASYIAGFLFVALLLPFIFPQWLYFPLLTLASVLVTASFIISFVQYLGAEEI